MKRGKITTRALIAVMLAVMAVPAVAYWKIPEFTTIAIIVGMIYCLFYFYQRKRQSRADEKLCQEIIVNFKEELEELKPEIIQFLGVDKEK
jgi:EamA domain-containing membrane protein RarD